MTVRPKKLIHPDDALFIFVDHQPQMAFGVSSIDRQSLKNNVVALAKAAKLFGAPIILTAVETEAFSGYIWPELLDVVQQKPIERTSMNSWDWPNWSRRSRPPAARSSSSPRCGPKPACCFRR